MNTTDLWDEIETLLKADGTLTGIIGSANNIDYPAKPEEFTYTATNAQVLIHSIFRVSTEFEAADFFLMISYFSKLGAIVENARDRVIALLHGATLSTTGVLSIIFDDERPVVEHSETGLFSMSMDFKIRGT